MAKLILEENEFTVELFLKYLTKKYGTKTNGVPFSTADIHDWALKRKVPTYYGGHYVRTLKIGPLKVLQLSDIPFKDPEKQTLKIESATH